MQEKRRAVNTGAQTFLGSKRSRLNAWARWGWKEIESTSRKRRVLSLPSTPVFTKTDTL
jgi:hypothetical protein